jgi:hypothetical protein
MNIRQQCPKCKAVYHSGKLEYCVCGGKLPSFAESLFGNTEGMGDYASIFNDMFSGKKKGSNDK